MLYCQNQAVFHFRSEDAPTQWCRVFAHFKKVGKRGGGGERERERNCEILLKDRERGAGGGGEGGGGFAEVGWVFTF